MISKEMVGASTIPILLTILLEGENYGYEIIKKVKENSGGTVEWSEPMLYPVLHRLERSGQIEANWRILDNGRKRKYYKITPAGRAALESKQAEWKEMIVLMSKMWNLQPGSI